METARQILQSMADALERMMSHGTVELSAAARGSADAYGAVLDSQQARRVADALRKGAACADPETPLHAMEIAPRDGSEVWLRVESHVEVWTFEYVPARWDAQEGLWIEDFCGEPWPRSDSNADGWLPLDAPKRDVLLREEITRRWTGTDQRLKALLGEDDMSA